MIESTHAIRIFDSHCHLDDRSYDRDRPAVLERARQAGVTKVMVVGVDLETSRKAVHLTEQFPECHAAVGMHPHDAKDCSDNALAELARLARHPGVQAWGEIGLDFNRMYSPRPVQEQWFIRQLRLAREFDLPLIFHERDSEGRLLELIAEHGGPGLQGVVHCFSGSPPELEAVLDYGLYVGITGILTLKERGAGLREMVRGIPAERILVETDGPYLTPAPEKNRVRRNEPAFVRSVLLKLANVRGEDPEGLAQTVWENTHRLYRVTF
jgi:TatD DNase family protein